MEFAPLCPRCGRPVPRECEWHAYGGCEDCWVATSGYPSSLSLCWNRKGRDGDLINLPLAIAAKAVKFKTRIKGCKPRFPQPSLAGANHVERSPEQAD